MNLKGKSFRNGKGYLCRKAVFPLNPSASPSPVSLSFRNGARRSIVDLLSFAILYMEPLYVLCVTISAVYYQCFYHPCSVPDSSQAPVPSPVSVGSVCSVLIHVQKQKLPTHQTLGQVFPYRSIHVLLLAPLASSQLSKLRRTAAAHPMASLGELWRSPAPRRRCLFPTRSWFYGHMR